MSYLSDPDRLERLAKYALDFPPNATPEELSLVCHGTGIALDGTQSACSCLDT